MANPDKNKPTSQDNNRNNQNNSSETQNIKPHPDRLKRAIALKYNPEINQAPQLIAAGQGLVADEIIRRAEQEGIHIYQNPELANTLSKLSLYQEIPEELYQAVAEVLAFVQTLERKSREGQ